MSKISPCLWFDTQAEEAVNFYLSVFENGKILKTQRYDEASAAVSGQPVGSLLLVDFELFGQTYTAMNGGPLFKFSQAISLAVECEDQAEVDKYWDKLVGEGGQAQPCGWLLDKYGLAWQIVPKQLQTFLSGPDALASGRAMEAMLKMTKLNVADLERAYNGE